MRRTLAVAAAVALAAGGIFLLLLAVDVHRWHDRMAADDLAYRIDPQRPRLWDAPQIVPGGIARRLLGVDDDIRARLAFQLFELGRPRLLVAGAQETAYRGAAQSLLSRALDADTSRARRSRELTLEGVLELIAAGGGDPQQRRQALPRAADSFRSAVELDGTSDDAKFDLELTLRLLQQIPGGGGAHIGNGGIVARDSHGGGGY